MSVLYNENNPYCAQALRNFIAGGIIPAGDVAECSIADLSPDDVNGYDHVHFFAGIGGWAYASILARWPADRQLWSGSCPCQPFSRAGRKRRTADPRHLWPHFHRLIRACRPAVVMGEQVSGPDGEIWIAGVCAGLEKDSFAIRAVDVPAYAIGAPHERQRIYWVAHPNRERQFQSQGSISDKSGWSSDCDATGRLEYSQSIRRIEGRSERSGRQRQPASVSPAVSSKLGDILRQRWPVRAPQPGSMGQTPGRWSRYAVERPDDASFWQDTQDIWCNWDQKCRRTKPGISYLVDGFPLRSHAFSAAGNAIVPQIAAEIMKAWLEEFPI